MLVTGMVRECDVVTTVEDKYVSQKSFNFWMIAATTTSM